MKFSQGSVSAVREVNSVSVRVVLCSAHYYSLTELILLILDLLPMNLSAFWCVSEGAIRSICFCQQRQL